MIKACAINVGVVDLNVDEVPLACAPFQVTVALYRVGPGRLARNVMSRVAICIGRQERSDFLSNRRVEKALGNQGYDLVTFVTPCESRRRASSDRNRKRRGGSGPMYPAHKDLPVGLRCGSEDRRLSDLVKVDCAAVATLTPEGLAPGNRDRARAMGRMVLTIFAGMAEFERELINEITTSGRVQAKARGVRFGRPPKSIGEQVSPARRQGGRQQNPVS
jgi:hypothetical protein